MPMGSNDQMSLSLVRVLFPTKGNRLVVALFLEHLDEQERKRKKSVGKSKKPKEKEGRNKKRRRRKKKGQIKQKGHKTKSMKCRIGFRINFDFIQNSKGK